MDYFKSLLTKQQTSTLPWNANLSNGKNRTEIWDRPDPESNAQSLEWHGNFTFCELWNTATRERDTEVTAEIQAS